MGGVSLGGQGAFVVFNLCLCIGLPCFSVLAVWILLQSSPLYFNKNLINIMIVFGWISK